MSEDTDPHGLLIGEEQARGRTGFVEEGMSRQESRPTGGESLTGWRRGGRRVPAWAGRLVMLVGLTDILSGLMPGHHQRLERISEVFPGPGRALAGGGAVGAGVLLL